MGNCANIPCGFDAPNENDRQSQQFQEDKYHQTIMSSTKKPILIRSQQKSDRIEEDMSQNNKENNSFRDGSVRISYHQSSTKGVGSVKIMTKQFYEGCSIETKSRDEKDQQYCQNIKDKEVDILKQSSSNYSKYVTNPMNDSPQFTNKTNKSALLLESIKYRDSYQIDQSKYQLISSNINKLHPIVASLLEREGSFDFEGGFKGDKIEGPLLFNTGEIYIGEMMNKMRHGKGKQTWKDGSYYEGWWKNDQAHGRGRLIHCDGDIYFGEWKQDRAHGKGIYRHNDSATYEGDWNDDLQHGKGHEKWPDGTSYKGDYVLGKKHGKGVFKWADGSFYEGKFKSNEIEGIGVYKWFDQREYSGYWVNNKMEGYGIFNWPDGRKYEGDYFDDKKHGYGVFIWPDGKVYQGFWANGKQNGYGLIKFQEEQERDGEWLNGKYIGSDQQKFSKKTIEESELFQKAQKKLERDREEFKMKKME